MNPSSGNPGINKLGKVLQQRMRETNASPLMLDFGAIQGDYSLLTNTYPIPIPKTDYLVCRQLTIEKQAVNQQQAQQMEATTFIVTLSKPVYARRNRDKPQARRTYTGKNAVVKPGDRVLVAWVQNDAVIDVVLPATKIEDEHGESKPVPCL